MPCIRVTQTRSFDTENAGSSYATGFVVDAKRGIILTNRHVVTPGPIVAEAVFLNREEISLKPIYRDPIHDFGFFRFDPTSLKFMKLDQIELAPDAAHVGLDIRVIGNDSGEKMSILPGVLARLDRDAPVYGKKTYNDFNCFYFQAASGTKGGSSGSPVVDCKGRAVALNAGGKTKAASAYYLPLEPIQRVLSIIQESTPDSSCSWVGWQAPNIPRGDLCATFLFKSMDEVKRLGLSPETEAQVRAAPYFTHGMVKTNGPSLNTGMLVVDSVVPGGPSDGLLEAGDVLVKINDVIMTHFLMMERVLDSNVGSSVHLSVERGGQKLELDIRVQDLHQASPSSLLEVAGGSLNALSYQQGRNFTSKLGLVQVIDPGYMLGRSAIPKGAIITRLAGQATPDLGAFATALSCLKHGERVPVEYFSFGDRHRKQQTLLNIDREWYGPPILWTRDDSLGVWHPSPLMQVDRGVGVLVKKEGSEGMEEMGEMEEEKEGDDEQSAEIIALEKKMKGCLVVVEVEIPLICLVDGVYSKSFAGTGCVVYQSSTLGLILVDRNTVVVGPSDIIVSFAASPCEITARVCFLHPLHNFCLVAYDPSQLPASARKMIHPVEIDLSPIKRGDEVYLAGATKCLQLMQKKCVVTSSTLALSIPTADVPRFRAVHEELIRLDTDFGSGFGGLLTNSNGQMRALWASYAEPEDNNEREWCAGLSSTVFYPWLQRVADHQELIISGQKPPSLKVTVLNAELEPLLLSKAAQHKLPQEFVSMLAKADPERKQVLKVKSTVALSHANEVLESGDMLLTCGGKMMTKFEDLDRLLDEQEQGSGSERAAKRYKQEDGTSKVDKSLTFTIFRSATDGDEGSEPAEGGKIMEVTVNLGYEEGMGTDRIVHFAGAQLQAPHRWAMEQGHIPKDCGVFISRWHHGSPSHRYGLFALHYITEVNGKCIRSLDEFVQEIKSLKDSEYARIKMKPLEAPSSKIIAVKMDLVYWPTTETILDSNGKWIKRQISASTDDPIGIAMPHPTALKVEA